MTPSPRASAGLSATGKFRPRTRPFSTQIFERRQRLRFTRLRWVRVRGSRWAERPIHVWVFVEQRQEDDDAFDDRRLDLVIQLRPGAVEPPLDGLEPVLPVGADRSRTLANGERNVVGSEDILRGPRRYWCAISIGPELLPQRPWRPANWSRSRRGHDQDFAWLSELCRQIADVLVDQRVVDDVAVHLRKRRVAFADPPQRNHELQEIGVRLLPERFLAATEQIVEQRGDRVRDRVRVEIVVQTGCSKSRCPARSRGSRRRGPRPPGCRGPGGRNPPSPPGPGHRLCDPDPERASAGVVQRTDTCRPTSFPCQRRPESSHPCRGPAAES